MSRHEWSCGRPALPRLTARRAAAIDEERDPRMNTAPNGPATMAISIRPATRADTEGISRVLQELVAAGKRIRPSDQEFTRTQYIENPHRIQCFVAVDEDGAILGFQSLSTAVEGNVYGTPTGWGMIGTHISPRAAHRGLGARLFTAMLDVARQAGVPAIEAYIGATNQEGQAYYEALGFRTYRRPDGVVCKCYEFR